MTTTTSQRRRPRKERTENADKRRRQLLDAAMRSVITNGLAKTTFATVADEAGLSQGVAVFYYKSKNGLLTALLKDIYQKYEDNWRQALADAEDDPKSQLFAIVQADFHHSICTPELLSVWFAFWGEQKFTPQYAEISGQFDIARSEAIGRICCEFFPDDPNAADELAEWVETLTDGYWQKLHLFPNRYSVEMATASTMTFIKKLLSAA